MIRSVIGFVRNPFEAIDGTLIQTLEWLWTVFFIPWISVAERGFADNFLKLNITLNMHKYVIF